MSDLDFWDANKKSVLKYSKYDHSNLYGTKRIVLIEKMNVLSVEKEKKALYSKRIGEAIEKISAELHKNKGQALGNYIILNKVALQNIFDNDNVNIDENNVWDLREEDLNEDFED